MWAYPSSVTVIHLERRALRNWASIAAIHLQMQAREIDEVPDTVTDVEGFPEQACDSCIAASPGAKY